MAFHQVPEVEYLSLIRYRLFTQVDPDKLAHGA